MRNLTLTRVLSLCIISLFFAIPNTAYAGNSVTFQNNKFQLQLTIKNAFYEDADSDGYDDDVVSFFSVDLQLLSSQNDDDLDDNDDDLEDDEDDLDDDEGEISNQESDDLKLKARLWVLLILPSDHFFIHRLFLVLNHGINNFKLTLFNEAIETGWYDLVLILSITNGGYTHGLADLTFDPPGTGGGDPVPQVERVDS